MGILVSVGQVKKLDRELKATKNFLTRLGSIQNE
jgi:hypothetical protein